MAILLLVLFILTSPASLIGYLTAKRYAWWLPVIGVVHTSVILGGKYILTTLGGSIPLTVDGDVPAVIVLLTFGLLFAYIGRLIANRGRSRVVRPLLLAFFTLGSPAALIGYLAARRPVWWLPVIGAITTLVFLVIPSPWSPKITILGVVGSVVNCTLFAYAGNLLKHRKALSALCAAFIPAGFMGYLTAKRSAWLLPIIGIMHALVSIDFSHSITKTVTQTPTQTAFFILLATCMGVLFACIGRFIAQGEKGKKRISILLVIVFTVVNPAALIGYLTAKRSVKWVPAIGIVVAMLFLMVLLPWASSYNIFASPLSWERTLIVIGVMLGSMLFAWAGRLARHKKCLSSICAVAIPASLAGYLTASRSAWWLPAIGIMHAFASFWWIAGVIYSLVGASMFSDFLPMIFAVAVLDKILLAYIGRYVAQKKLLKEEAQQSLDSL